MDLKQLVGRNCRRLRLAAGLKQEELAHEIGIDQALMSRIEAGSQNITLATIAKLARALGCRPVDLLAEDEEAAR